MVGNERGGNAWLLRFIESPHFTLFRCVSYLEQYAGNLGIHFHLCQKIRSYPSEEIEFFLPQLVQLQVTVETESMALEDLLLDLCNESPHCTLLIFWQLQAHMVELSSDPDSFPFQICRRLFNKIQHLLFNQVGEQSQKEDFNRFKENPQPALILSSALAAGVGVPQLGPFIKPLAMSQGRKQRSHVFHLASKLLRSKSTSTLKNNKSSLTDENGNAAATAAASTPDLNTTQKNAAQQRIRSIDGYHHHDNPSLPDVTTKVSYHSPSPSVTSTTSNKSTRSVDVKPTTTAFNTQLKINNLLTMSRDQKVNTLKTNYFRCETQFVYALQAISTRLLQVPKQARLSALRAELAMLNRDLPAEVDIPMLLPAPENGKQNKIVRIAPAEATVLNSAERVPFLLLIEYLRDEVDFDPDTDDNKELLMQDDSARRYIFDLGHVHDLKSSKHPGGGDGDGAGDDELEENEEERDMGDISAIPMNRQESFAQDALTASLQGLSTSSDYLSRDATKSPRTPDLSFQPSYRPATPVHHQNHPQVDVTDIATHMRTAAVMLTQLESGASKLTKMEVESIKNKIIASMQSMEENTIYGGSAEWQGEAGERKLENDMKTAGMSSGSTAQPTDDPSAKNLGEDWTKRKERIRRSSPYGHLPNWDLTSVIAKTGDDLRQEAFACQLILAVQKIWLENDVDVWVKRMRILITNDSSGLVETITNGLSVHSIKKSLTIMSMKQGLNPKGTICSLVEHFEHKFGAKTDEAYINAQKEFVKSLAAYSIICYILQIKDRHNGNILLDNQGHIIHIDFGFLLSNSPGRFGFEAAPFKLTQEYVEVMGGVDSEFFEMFREKMKQGFKVLRKNAESIIILVEMMAKDSNLPCFYSGAATALQLRNRFQLGMSDSEVESFVDNVLIQKSLGSIYTRLYDQYQFSTQGIYS